MAVYSRIDLRNTVAEDLTIKDANSALSAEDAVALDARIQSKLEALADDGLIPFDLDGSIPAPYLVPLSQVICPTCLGAFGLLAKKAEYEADEMKGMKALRRLKAKPYFGTPAQADYF